MNQKLLKNDMLPKILVVEDDPVARGLLELYLETDGYDFTSVTDGKQALELFERYNFQIVITDWLMPELDGIELCRKLRAMGTEHYTYLILLTSQGSQSSMVEGLEAGADEYIVKPIHHPELRARLKGARRILELESSLKKSLEDIRELTIRDSLTGAFNRNFMDQQLAHEIRRAYRYEHALSVILFDIDFFKLINDTYGHQAGDEALRQCVVTVTGSIRNNIDWVARYGGEEFLVVLPETDMAGCHVVAERIRQQIELRVITYRAQEFRMTASFGAVTISPLSSQVPSTVDSVLHNSDTCLYQAKLEGRNRIISRQILHNNEGP